MLEIFNVIKKQLIIINIYLSYSPSSEELKSKLQPFWEYAKAEGIARNALFCNQVNLPHSTCCKNMNYIMFLWHFCGCQFFLHSNIVKNLANNLDEFIACSKNGCIHRASLCHSKLLCVGPGCIPTVPQGKVWGSPTPACGKPTKQIEREILQSTARQQ